MPKGHYHRTKPTGFLHPQRSHEVTVDGIGIVYRGRNKRDAEREFARWSGFAERPIGRASGKIVVHTTDGKITNEHKPN